MTPAVRQNSLRRDGKSISIIKLPDQGNAHASCTPSDGKAAKKQALNSSFQQTRATRLSEHGRAHPPRRHLACFFLRTPPRLPSGTVRLQQFQSSCLAEHSSPAKKTNFGNSRPCSGYANLVWASTVGGAGAGAALLLLLTVQDRRVVRWGTRRS